LLSHTTGNRSIVYIIKDKQNREEFRINSGLSNLLEPLGYPLFFVNGENGWSWKHDRKIVDLRSYIYAKIFMPEKDEHNNFILCCGAALTKLRMSTSGSSN